LLPFANVLWFARAAAGFPRDFFSRGSHWVAHVRTCACVSLSWYRHIQLVFSGGLAPLAAQRVDGTGTEQQSGPPLGRAMAWPWPLACKVRSGALGGKSCMSTPKEPTFGRGGIFSERFSAVSRRVRCAAAMKGYSHSASTKGRVAPTNIRTGAAATTVCYAALPSRTRNVE